MKDNFTISVSPKGTIFAIYDDELHELFEQGDARIRRASHVEPTVSGKWIADMSLAVKRFEIECDNPILGPFDLRQQALDAEHAWLEEKLFGVRR